VCADAVQDVEGRLEEPVAELERSLEGLLVLAGADQREELELVGVLGRGLVQLVHEVGAGLRGQGARDEEEDGDEGRAQGTAAGMEPEGHGFSFSTRKRSDEEEPGDRVCGARGGGPAEFTPRARDLSASWRADDTSTSTVAERASRMNSRSGATFAIERTRRDTCAPVRIAELFGRGRPVFSFEFFPPKTDEAAHSMLATVRDLADMLAPDFVSVTYGAGGSTRGRTIELVSRMQSELGLTTMAHLTCVGHTREELAGILDRLATRGIRNVLALRGDPPGGSAFQVTEGGFRYASELASFVRERGRFCIGGACYPEKHPESPSREEDLRWAAHKGRQRRRVPHHAAVLRQRGLLPLRGAGRARPGSPSRSSPASCPSRACRRSSASPRCAAPASRPSSTRACSASRTIPRS
jgi:hypothetical protein